MSRTLTSGPRRGYRLPGLGDRRPGRRVVIFIIVVLFAASMLMTGSDLPTVLTTLIGVGLTGATIARWVVDGMPLPSLSSPLVAQTADGGQG